MTYTPRTLMRHLLLFVVLASIPAWLQSGAEARLWYAHNGLRLGLVVVLGLGVGSLAHRLVGAGLVFAGLRRLAGRASTEAGVEPASPGPVWRLVLAWGSCSRCVSYWTAGAFGAGSGWLAWPGAHWYGDLLRAVYLGSMAASLAAATAVAMYLFEEARAADEEGDTD